MAFDATITTTTTTNKNQAMQSRKAESHLTPISDMTSSIYHQAIEQQTHRKKAINLHHYDQHELENARLLESDKGMDGLDGDLALLLNDLSMNKPSSPSHFMPYCA